MFIIRKHFIAVILVLSILCLFSVMRVLGQDDSFDICILGAGPSGMTAAYFGEAKGHRVAVIEKNSFVGGRTKIFQANDGRRYRMGAVILEANEPLKELLKKFDIPTDIISGKRKYYRGTEIVHWDPVSFKVMRQLRKYMKVRKSLLKYLQRAAPFLSEYPTELNRPMEQWLDENGMSEIKPLFSLVMTSFGYGHIRDVPAIYAIKYVSSNLLFQLFTPFRQVAAVVMYQDLFKTMADNLQGFLYLNAEITSVAYETDGNVINFSQDGNNMTLYCGSIIVAFIPTPSAMVKLIPPGFEILSSLLEQIQLERYYTLLLDDRNGDVSHGMSSLYHIPLPAIPNDPAINVLYVKAHNHVDSHVVAYYLTPTEKPDQQVQNESLLHYNRLFHKNVNVEGIYDFNRWVYFPHLSTASLNEGFFKTFENLQGQYHQYYTGSLFTFDTVVPSMAEGQRVIEKYF